MSGPASVRSMPVLWLLLAALATAVPLRVRAEPRETPAEASKRLAWEGIEAYKAQDYALAVERFRAAYAASSDDPLLLYYLARAADRQGEAKAAIGHYEGYLKAGPDPANVEQVRASLDRLRSALPGVIEASCRPAATLTLSGLRPTACPGRVESVAPGIYEVEVEAPGHRPWSERVEVRPGAAARVEVALEPLPGLLAVTSLPEGARVTLDGEAVGLTPLDSVPVQPGTHRVGFEKEGYQPAAHDVDVLPGAPSSVRLELRRVPGRPEPAGAQPEPAAVDRSWVLVRGVAAGIAVVGAVVGMVALSGVHSEAVADGRRAAGVDRGAYSAARDRAQLAGVAYYGLGALAAAAGGYSGYVWLTLPEEEADVGAGTAGWRGAAWAWTW